MPNSWAKGLHASFRTVFNVAWAVHPCLVLVTFAILYCKIAITQLAKTKGLVYQHGTMIQELPTNGVIVSLCWIPLWLYVASDPH